MGQPRSSGHHFSLSSTGSQSSPTTTSESISPHSKPKVCLDIVIWFRVCEVRIVGVRLWLRVCEWWGVNVRVWLLVCGYASKSEGHTNNYLGKWMVLSHIFIKLLPTHDVQCTSCVHCTVYTIQCKLLPTHDVQCILYSVQCKVYTVHYTLYNV